MQRVTYALFIVLFLAPVGWAQDALTSTADSQQAALEKAATALDEAKSALAKAKDDEKDAAQKTVDAAQATLDAAVKALAATVEQMENEGLTVRPYKAALYEATGDSKYMGTDAALGIAEKWFNKGKTWITDNGLTILTNLVIFLIILFVFKILARIAGKIVSKALSTSKLKVSNLLRDFFINVVQKVVFFVGLLVALPYIGVDIGPFLAGIGVLGFVVGFALQGTLANFAAGIMILLYRPYDLGNVISAAGITGKVEAMSLVSTTLVTPDNQVHVVPNGSIWGGVITNITARDTRRVDLTMGCGYDDDLGKAQEVIEGVVNAHELVLKDPAPTIQVHTLGASSVDFVVRPWAKTSDYWTVYFDLTRSLKEEFDKAGLSIPYPQRDVHIHQQPSASE